MQLFCQTVEKPVFHGKMIQAKIVCATIISFGQNCCMLVLGYR